MVEECGIPGRGWGRCPRQSPESFVCFELSDAPTVAPPRSWKLRICSRCFLQDVDAGIDTEASDEVLDVQPAPDTDAENSARGENQFMNALDEMEDEGMMSEQALPVCRTAEGVLAESDGHDSFASEKQAVQEAVVKLAGESAVDEAGKTTQAEPDVAETPSLDQLPPASAGQEAEQTAMPSTTDDAADAELAVAEASAVQGEDMITEQAETTRVAEAVAEDPDQQTAAPETAAHSTDDAADAELVVGEASAVDGEDMIAARAETTAVADDPSLDQQTATPETAVHSATDDAADAELAVAEASAVQGEDMITEQAETTRVAEAVAEDPDQQTAAPETAAHSTDDAADAELVVGEASAVDGEDMIAARAETTAVADDPSLDQQTATPETAVHSATDDAADAELAVAEASAVQGEDMITEQAETTRVAEAVAEDPDQQTAAPETAAHSTDDAADAELVVGEASAVDGEDMIAARAETTAVADDPSLDQQTATPETAVHSATDDAADAELAVAEASAVQGEDMITEQAETTRVAEAVAEDPDQQTAAPETAAHSTDDAADAELVVGEASAVDGEDMIAARAETTAVADDPSLDQQTATPETAVHSATDDAADAELAVAEASAVQGEDMITEQAETTRVAEAVAEDPDQQTAAPETAAHSTDDAADAELVVGEASAVDGEDMIAARAETTAVADDPSLDQQTATPETAVHSATDDTADAELVVGEASAVQEEDVNAAQAGTRTETVAEGSSFPVSSGGQETTDPAAHPHPLTDGAADAGSFAGECTVGSNVDTFATRVGKASSNGVREELQDTSQRDSVVSSMAVNLEADAAESSLHLEAPEASPSAPVPHGRISFSLKVRFLSSELLVME